jgi:hypothetical protein
MIEVYHVLPNNDLQEHKESSICGRNPTIETYPNGNVVIIHNSYDGREGLEMANEILGL